MLSENEKEEILGIKSRVPTSEEMLAKRLAIAMEALCKIEILQPEKNYILLGGEMIDYPGPSKEFKSAINLAKTALREIENAK